MFYRLMDYISSVIEPKHTHTWTVRGLKVGGKPTPQFRVYSEKEIPKWIPYLRSNGYSLVEIVEEDCDAEWCSANRVNKKA